MKHALAALALTAPLVSACGFSPVYTADAPASAGAIEVSAISGRTGYELRKALRRELAAGLPGIPPGASLSIELKDGLRRLPLRPDGAATRADLRAQADYRLDYDGGKLTGSVEADSSFNVPGEAYGDIAAQIASRERAAQLVAQRIATDLRMKARNAEPG